MWKKILLGLAVVIIAFVIIVATRPDDFRFSRATTVAAPPATVFPFVNDLQKWQTWSPWAKLDPDCKYTFEGPVAGSGARLSWSGNDEVGEGSMTITESKPGELVRYKLVFVKPMAAECDTEFALKPAAGGTGVTWTMSGKNNFICKAMGLFMDCEKMCGEQFEEGFKNLKSVVNEPKTAPAPVNSPPST
jgi:hypothetical protein